MLWPISTMSIRQTRSKGQHNLRSENFDEQLETNDPTNPPCWEHGHLTCQTFSLAAVVPMHLHLSACPGTHTCKWVLPVYGLMEYWYAENLRPGWQLQWQLGAQAVLQRWTQLVSEAEGGGSQESTVLFMNFHSGWKQPRAHPEPSERL